MVGKFFVNLWQTYIWAIFAVRVSEISLFGRANVIVTGRDAALTSMRKDSHQQNFNAKISQVG